MAVGTTIDSFKFLWEQIEREVKQQFNGAKDILAILGGLYVAHKTLTLVCKVSDYIAIHILPQGRVSWIEKYGPWAVITGSSEGIGFAYAYELALRGLNIVLISRNERKLIKAKTEIEQDCKVKVEYIVADFASDKQNEVYQDIEEKLSYKEIGLLVNNVGVMYDYPDVLLNISRQKLWQLVYVNIGAATMMTHMLLPDMVRRGRGGIVVLSSGSSTQITPQMTVYSATKRYLDYFIQGIAYEYRHSGVTFQSLIPFYVATRMTGYSNRLSRHSVFIPDAGAYARSAVSTLGKSFVTTGYFMHTVLLWFAHSLPWWLWMWGSEKLNNSLRQEALNRIALRKLKSELGPKGSGTEQSDDQLT